MRPGLPRQTAPTLLRPSRRVKKRDLGRGSRCKRKLGAIGNEGHGARDRPQIARGVIGRRPQRFGERQVAANGVVADVQNATGLAAGSYAGNLCVTSNDPDAGPGNGTALVVVPVSLTVDAPLPPEIFSDGFE